MAKRSDLLMKLNGLRKVSGMSWKDLADIFEAETGEKVSPRRLQFRVGSCMYSHRRKLERGELMELEKEDLVSRCEEVEAMEARSKKGFFSRLAAWFRSLFKKGGSSGSGSGVPSKKIQLEWKYGNCNGSKAVEDTSASGYKLTKFTFDGKTVKFDGVGAMWGYDHDHHDARNCLFFKEGDKYVGGFFEWGDPSRKSRQIANITGRYGGWEPAKVAAAKEFAFCLTDKAGKKRTNVLTYKR